MRTTKLTLIFALATVLSLSFLSCGDSQEHTKSEPTANNTHTTNKESNILDKYLEIKDALVQTDGESASKAASEMVKFIGDDPSESLQKIRIDAQNLAETKNINHQRDHFNSLSINTYEWVKSTDSNEQTLYRQYCPMAFDNQGAYWLSAEKKVYNPYFGDKMLHCGSVKEEL